MIKKNIYKKYYNLLKLKKIKTEKGVSLYLTVMIISIFLFVIFSLSVILFYQLRETARIGDSVVAFYASDSGIERALYDEKVCLFTDASQCADIGCEEDKNKDNYCDGVSSENYKKEKIFSNKAKYEVKFVNSSFNYFQSRGKFRKTNRAIQISIP